MPGKAAIFLVELPLTIEKIDGSQVAEEKPIHRSK